MLGDRATGLARSVEVVQAAPGLGFVEWTQALLVLLSAVKGKSGRRTEGLLESRYVLNSLDEVLRSETTVAADDHPDIQRNPRRLQVLQWELKRTCLAAVLQGLPPSPRATFVLMRLMGYSDEQMSSVFGVTMPSIVTNLSRAERALSNYLGVRCQHVAPGNFCRCEARLGGALKRGFVRWPEEPEQTPERPVFSTASPDVGALYRSLPSFAVDEASWETLRRAASTSPATQSPCEHRGSSEHPSDGAPV